ncbi:lysophospholipid acyltransferase family protein [Pararhodobacter zhoushanensis]|uniref:Lysophospholipid acyltransferase family protein n=1 Tax=Pararhodobacter zhoushanensis TaxID=2479545 RepID=A0ABT3H315_9RHOB|nr:lysophospholipid acyltransferase family protein [Pararhodobacter zhoushanensis]MCW1934220.1 lysophospholipid acyltransferase family protein [Pararhodobacter zhoushanensis]
MTQNPAPTPRRVTPRDRATLALVGLLMRLPFGPRVRLAGWLGRTVIGRFGALPRRVAQAVHHFRPELPEVEVQRIAREVPGSMARMITEVLSGPDLAALAATLPLEGPGLAALDDAHATGRPVILVSAHFGNYDAWRLALIARGFAIGGYFKELGSPALNARYVEAVSASGAPMFPDTGEGLRRLVKFLRGGGMLGILCDLDRPQGVMLDFLGQPTRTVLSMAEMALRYDALLVPIWGIRTPGKPGFRVQIDAPVPASDAETMTQALNDAFAAQVRAHPEQWIWWHNRRKGSHP